MAGSLHEVSTEELLALLGKQETCIIDVRSVDAYNGWRLEDEARGGHINSARSLPAKWTSYLDWIEMVRHKQIHPGHHLVVYGYNEADSARVASNFLKSGYTHVSVYNRFTEEWSGNPAFPIEQLERFHQLVPARWINMLISGVRPPYSGNGKFLVVHAHYRNRKAYLDGHIPGAIDMDTMAIEEPETWNRRNPQELKKAMEDHGITSDTTVIMYGKFMFPDYKDPFPGSAAGDIGAIRCAFTMMYAGVKDVRVLNGGFQSWQDEGYEISYADVPKTTVPEFGAEIPVHPEFAIDTPEARLMLASPGAELVCVRSWPEYIGEVSGYNYIEKKGRIPGAIFADCGSDAYHMEKYRNFDHTSREYHEIAENWIKSGITPDKHLAFYCGTGWRGSEAWFNAWLMGWPRVSVYDGGWYEWSSDPGNPVETGIPFFDPGSQKLSSPGKQAGMKSYITITGMEDHESNQEIIAEILAGLSAPQKTISSRFFYDDDGSALFEKITGLPEYYLARTEISILEKAGPAVVNNPAVRNIVELGSGDWSKISILLDTMPWHRFGEIIYTPVDISKSSLEKSASALVKKYPGIRIQCMLSDFMKDHLKIPRNGNRLICFFGSTIGNLGTTREVLFLSGLKALMAPGDQLLVGFDMVKDIGILEKAYNDAQGITAAFNKNILNVVNRHVKTNFDPGCFEHLSFYNTRDQQIEMHLKALSDIKVSSPYQESDIFLRQGETIHTENSQKYHPGYIRQLATRAGLRVKEIYTDPRQWFSLVHFQ